MNTRWLRLIALVLGLGLLIVLASLSGVRESMTEERLRQAVTEAGWWGLGSAVGLLGSVGVVVFLSEGALALLRSVS